MVFVTVGGNTELGQSVSEDFGPGFGWCFG